MKKTIAIIIISVVVILGVVAFNGFKTYKEESKAKMEKLNDEFTYSLCLVTEAEVDYNKVEVKSITELSSTARIRICYYNYYNDDDLSYELLMEEYEKFCDGKKGYKNLKSYSDFIRDKGVIPYEQRQTGNLHVEDFSNQVKKSIANELEMDYTNYLEMNPEDINRICGAMLEREDEVHERIVLEYLEMYADYPHPLFSTNIEYEQSGSDEGQEIIVESEDGNLIYHLAYGNVKWLSDEKEWYVRKIEIIGGDYSVCKVGIGSSSFYWLETSIIPCGFECTRNDDNQIVYSRDSVVFTINLKDGKVAKMVVEVVR